MKFPIQYVSDQNGNPMAIQLPISEWKKLLNRLQKYEASLKLKSDLREAFEQVGSLKKSKSKGQSLDSFLHEL